MAVHLGRRGWLALVLHLVRSQISVVYFSLGRGHVALRFHFDRGARGKVRLQALLKVQWVLFNRGGLAGSAGQARHTRLW